MVPLRLADTIQISYCDGPEINLSCNVPDLCKGPENLCVKAALAFRKSTGLNHGIDISLIKRIPHGAGLGGGSSDAASVLQGLNDLFNGPLDEAQIKQIASRLGSDVPFFLGDGPAWCGGRGEIIEPFDHKASVPARRVLLIKPPFPVPTDWAYKMYDILKKSGKLPEHSESQRLVSLEIFNDLEVPVFHKYVLLEVLKNWLRHQAIVEVAFMSGSGSTIAGIIYPEAPADEVDRLKASILEEFGSATWMALTEFSN